MSKSRGNVINPDDVVGDFGADSLRLYEMFMGPLRDTKVGAGLVGFRVSACCANMRVGRACRAAQSRRGLASGSSMLGNFCSMVLSP